MFEERLKLVWKHIQWTLNLDNNIIKIELNLAPNMNFIYFILFSFS
jgi:hypothetical protein